MRKIIWALAFVSLAACGRPQGNGRDPFASFEAKPASDVTLPQSQLLQDDTKAPDTESTPAPAKPVGPIKAFWEELWHDGKYVNHPEWTQATVDALKKFGGDVLASTPRDVLTFCPNYMNLDGDGRLEFWVKLISSVSLPESDFHTASHMTEPLKVSDSKSANIVSRGLLQVSLEDAQRHGCAFKTESDLNDPTLNIQCGVKILNDQLKSAPVISATTTAKDGSIRWLGGSSYWSVLRPTHKAFASVRDRVAKSAICQLPH